MTWQVETAPLWVYDENYIFFFIGVLYVRESLLWHLSTPVIIVYLVSPLFNKQSFTLPPPSSPLLFSIYKYMYCTYSLKKTGVLTHSLLAYVVDTENSHIQYLPASFPSPSDPSQTSRIYPRLSGKCLYPKPFFHWNNKMKDTLPFCVICFGSTLASPPLLLASV